MIRFDHLIQNGNRISNSLKVFLMMLAIFDDLLVIGIIGLFFSDSLEVNYLIAASICCIALAILNYKNVENFAPFAIIGFILWYFILKSGIHATVAGIILALFIPMTARNEYNESNGLKIKRSSMLESLEHSLHEFVSFGVLPIFAFINAGVLLSLDGFKSLDDNMSLGIIFGLFFGKQIGVFLTAFVLIKLKFATLPKDSNMGQLYGVSILCGIGFTMGLFIGGLAFNGADVAYKLPILVGSLLSAIFGLLILHLTSKK